MSAEINESAAYIYICRRLRLEYHQKVLHEAYKAASKELNDTLARAKKSREDAIDAYKKRRRGACDEDVSVYVTRHIARYKEATNAAIVEYSAVCSRAVKSFTDATQVY